MAGGRPERFTAHSSESASLRLGWRRHARLSAMKLAGDPNNPLRAIRDDITVDESPQVNDGGAVIGNGMGVQH
jgi:hypothetical protein